MAAMDVRDPALAPLPPVQTVPPIVEAPPVAAPAAVTPLAHPPATDAASTLFGNFADTPATTAAAPPAIAPHLVKSQAIHPDAAGLNQAIANASGLTKAELPTAASTTGQVIEESGEAGVTNLNQVAYELATARRESHMGNWMNEFGGNSWAHLVLRRCSQDQREAMGFLGSMGGMCGRVLQSKNA